jgi:hypothetical protein
MSFGLLNWLTEIPEIMREQGVDWQQAEALWKISKEVEAERHQPTAVIIPFPTERVR